jgi:hypothetical protein
MTEVNEKGSLNNEAALQPRKKWGSFNFGRRATNLCRGVTCVTKENGRLRVKQNRKRPCGEETSSLRVQGLAEVCQRL